MLENSISIMKNIINELSEITRVENHHNEEVGTEKLGEIIKEVRLTLMTRLIKTKPEYILILKNPN